MIETKPKKIDGIEFQVTQFLGRPSFRIKARLIRLIGPAMLLALSGDRKKVPAAKKAAGLAGMDLDLGAIAKGIQTLSEAMDPDEMVAFVMELLGTTQMKVNGNWVPISDEVFDMEFAGKMHVVYQLLAFVVGVNYGSFFGAGGIGATILNRTGMTQGQPST